VGLDAGIAAGVDAVMAVGMDAGIDLGIEVGWVYDYDVHGYSSTIGFVRNNQVEKKQMSLVLFHSAFLRLPPLVECLYSVY
jgi:hypothetical protein